MKLSMAKKLILTIGILFGIALIVLQYINFKSTKAQIVQEEVNHYQLIKEVVTSSMDNELKIAETSILSITNNEEIAKLFAIRDRENLLRLLKPVYDELSKKGIAQFQFHLSPATSFLRVHKPEKFGDDLSSFRNTVVACNNEKKIIKGLEEGVAGYGFRVVVPVYYEGEHIGSAEYGSAFNQTFLNKIKDQIPGEFYIYSFNQGSKDKKNYLAATTSDDPYSVSEEYLSKIKTNDNLTYTYSENKQNSLILIPFKDYSGETKGYIKAVVSRERAINEYNSLVKKSIILALFSMLIILIIVYLLVNRILNPLKKLNIILDDIANAEGDLTQRVEINSQDETGKLANSTNKMLESLQRTITDIVVIVNGLSSSTKEVTQAIESSNASLQETATVVEEVSAGAKNNANILKEFQEAADEVANTAQLVTNASNEATEESLNVTLDIKKSLVAIDEVGNKVNGLDEERKEIDNVVSELVKTTEDISNFVTVITGIAEQTNLLALNAAIEAARAGEHGKGFAVVAEEVRKLAENSSNSAREIESIIADNKSKIQKAILTNQNIGTKIIDTVSNMDEAKTKIHEIALNIEKVNEKIKETTKIAEEQSALSEQIHASVEDISQTTEETANGTEQITTSLVEESSILQKINITMDELDKKAEELLKQVKGFHV